MRTFNSAKSIDKALKSIYSQIVQNHKINIVIYDDKSTDDTLQHVKLWQEKFKKKEISLQLTESSAQEHEGCGKAQEHLSKIVASLIQNDDICVWLDSDDSFTTETALAQISSQMEKNNANICLISYEHSGDKNLVINKDGGKPHNRMAASLAEAGLSTVSQNPKIASEIDSMGWLKVVTGDILKTYVNILPEHPKEMNVCEDFPTLAMLLFKKARITGCASSLYSYYKHTESSTSSIIQPEAFTVCRLGFLKTLQGIVSKNPDLFIDNAQDCVNLFLETKYNIISGIVRSKNKAGLTSLTEQEFQKAFHEQIDCTNLNIQKPITQEKKSLQNFMFSRKRTEPTHL